MIELITIIFLCEMTVTDGGPHRGGAGNDGGFLGVGQTVAILVIWTGIVYVGYHWWHGDLRLPQPTTQTPQPTRVAHETVRDRISLQTPSSSSGGTRSPKKKKTPKNKNSQSTKKTKPAKAPTKKKQEKAVTVHHHHHYGPRVAAYGNSRIDSVTTADRDAYIDKSQHIYITNVTIYPHTSWGCDNPNRLPPKEKDEMSQSLFLEYYDRPKDEVAYDFLSGDQRSEGEMLPPVSVVAYAQETAATDMKNRRISTTNTIFLTGVPSEEKTQMVDIKTEEPAFQMCPETSTVGVYDQLEAKNCCSHSGLSAVLNAANRMFHPPELPTYFQLLSEMHPGPRPQDVVAKELIAKLNLPMDVKVISSPPPGKVILTKNVMLAIYTTSEVLNEWRQNVATFPADQIRRARFLKKYRNLRSWGDDAGENKECEAHGVLVESYNFMTQRYRCKNSWGPRGSNGRFEIDAHAAPAHLRWIVVSLEDGVNDDAKEFFEPPLGAESDAGWFLCNKVRADYDDTIVCRRLKVQDRQWTHFAVKIHTWIAWVEKLRQCRNADTEESRTAAEKLMRMLKIEDEQSTVVEDLETQKRKYEGLIDQLNLIDLVVVEVDGRIEIRNRVTEEIVENNE